MKKILLILLSCIYANALTLTLNSAKQSGQPYSMLHLEDEDEILCETKSFGFEKEQYLCTFNSDAKNLLQDKSTPLVDIEFKKSGKKFYIYIKPKYHSRMINTDVKLYEHKTTPLPSDKMAKHWTILIYNKKPFKKEGESGEGINFPVTFPQYQYPSVGSLDLNGKPIDYAKGRDMQLYLDLKKDYKNGRYDSALEVVKRIVKEYPKTIFMSDVLLYRLLCIDKLLDRGDDIKGEEMDRSMVVAEAKKWLKTFPAENSAPEVDMIIVKSYLDMGFRKEANYYLDNLISQFPKDKYTQEAILIYADYLYKNRKKKEAVKLYEKVLYSSRDIDTASKAAIRLSKNALKSGEKQKAKEYLDKVLKANENFIYQDKADAYKLAQNLAKQGLSKSAATIAKTLLSKTRRINEDYEMLLKDVGIWSEQAGEIKEASKYLKRYLKEYKNGDYKNLVQQAQDRLFFQLNETNSTKLLSYYDELIKRYDNDIGKKALFEKAKLLLKSKDFKGVLELKSLLLKDANNTAVKDLLSDAESLAVDDAISRDDCLMVAKLIKENSALESKIKDKKQVYECMMRTKNYTLAKNQALELARTDDLPKKLTWMINLQHALYALGWWKDTVQVADDTRMVADLLKEDKDDVILYDKFYSLVHLNDYEKALSTCKEIETKMPGSFKNVEVFGKIVSMAKQKGNDLVVINYAKKALDIEDRAKSYVLSPNLEYNYINSLDNLKRYGEAKDVAMEILQRKLDKNERGRALYTVAEAYAKMQDSLLAREFFQKCIEFDENSSWGKICADNLKLMPEDTNATNTDKNASANAL